ncbi:gpsA [Symbiodinium natans]|uniref:Glycerol-3-phosphate dehydrogenase [NAD(+)] n=1 Tax=Symbiodinium natans TaxID=878477 RepID=A0A812R1J3_9DINO|nr:gpsA [Symbiodinium natans]
MANHVASKGIFVSLWAREEEVVQSINSKHENSTFLAGVPLSEKIVATGSVAEAVSEAELLFLIIPTPFIAKWLEQNQPMLPWQVPLVCFSKGIEQQSLRTPYEILVDELPGKYHAKLAVVSGPSFAKEIGVGLPTSVTCAAQDIEVAKQIQLALATRNFRVYTAADVIGAELCGALKNVLAIACGASDGFGFGANARAALITRGLAEMTRLVVKKGGKASTITGLAGVGDLVLTCSSSLSRNYSVGQAMAARSLPEDKRKDQKQSNNFNRDLAVAEGVKTSLAVHLLAEKLGVEMPICEAVYEVIHKGIDIKTALRKLQDRPLRAEHDEYQGTWVWSAL